jgi:fucose 4-O-acetylase-like acetyltransferase
MTAFRTLGQRVTLKAFNTGVLQNKRLTWVDYLRGITIILVVYHHARVGIERSHITVPQILVNANMIFYSFRMPLFFVLSGLFVSYSLSKKTIKQLSWIKFENLLYPYLLWSFIQVTLQIALSDFTNSTRSLVDYTYILYQPRRLDQFWYLPALFNTTMVFFFVLKFLKPSLVMHLVIGLCFYFLSPFTARFSMVSDWMFFYIFFAVGHVFSGLFFKEGVQTFFRKATSLLFIIPVFIVAQVFYLKYEVGQQTLAVDVTLSGFEYIFRFTNQLYFLLIALIGCITVFLLSFQLEKWNRLSFLRVLGCHSLYIYVMHVMVVAFARAVLVKVLGVQSPVLLLTVCLFFGLTVPVVFYNLCVKDKWGWFLFSIRKRRSPGKELKAEPGTVRVKQQSISSP